MQYDPDATGPRALIGAVDDAGFEASLDVTRHAPPSPPFTAPAMPGTAAVMGGPLKRLISYECRAPTITKIPTP